MIHEHIYQRMSPTNSENEDEGNVEFVEENVDYYKCIIGLEIVAVFAGFSIGIILPIFYHENETLLTQFSMGSDKIGLAILVVVEVFLVILVTACVVDMNRRVRKMKEVERSKSGNEDDQPKIAETKNKPSGSRNEELPLFILRKMMTEMNHVALMEVGLLARNTADEARRRRLCLQENQTNYSLEAFSEYMNGISVQYDKRDISCHNLRATVVLAGPPCVGKTSIFSRILYDKYNSQVIPTLGFDYGLKTLKASGKNMFGKQVSMDVGMHIWDTSGSDTMKGLSLAYFRDHVILIVVCDVMDSTSLHGLLWWVSSMKAKVHDPYVAVFLNKIDLEDRTLTAEDLTGEPALEGVGIFEVSAKTGEGVLESFTQVICQAICQEAEKIVQSGIEAQNISRVYPI